MVLELDPLFQIGLFFLPSSALLGGGFLLSATIFAAFHRTDSFWKDKWNYPLVVIAVWMIIGCITAYSGWLAWIGLANWLPLFWLFWGCFGSRFAGKIDQNVSEYHSFYARECSCM